MAYLKARSCTSAGLNDPFLTSEVGELVIDKMEVAFVVARVWCG